MTTHTYRITGHILHSDSDHGFAHHRLEIWDFGPFLLDLVASTATDENGHFEVAFVQPHVEEFLPFHHHPHLFLKLFRGDQPISLAGCVIEVFLPGSTEPHTATGYPVLLDVPPGETRITLKLKLPEGFVVHGVVRRAEGTPLAGAPVKAFDEDLRQEQLLGEATTDPAGQYRISYTSAQFHRPNERIHCFDTAWEALEEDMT